MPGYLVAKSDRGLVKKSDIVEIRHSEMPGTEAELEHFGYVEVEPANSMQELRPYVDQWELDLSWNTPVQISVIGDIFNTEVFASNPGDSGAGNLQASDISEWAELNNGLAIDQADNLVDIELKIYSYMISQGFWGRFNADLMIFDELSYDEVTGVHQIQADYSALGLSNPAHIEAHLATIELAIEGSLPIVTVVSNSSNIVIYEAKNLDLLDYFLAHTREYARRIIAKFRYKVDVVIATEIALAADYVEPSIEPIGTVDRKPVKIIGKNKVSTIKIPQAVPDGFIIDKQNIL